MSVEVKARAKWLRIEEHTNALDYLVRVYQFLTEVDKNYYSWKWVMIALHGSIYGFAISACRGADSTSVIKTSKKGNEWLINFDTALKRCQDSSWMKYAMSPKTLVLTVSQKESIRRMKDLFRNEFEHFKPKGWSIEIHGFPIITLDCLEVIRFLAIETDTPFSLGSTKVRKIKSIIFQCKKLIRNSTLYKETKQIVESSK